MVDCVDVFRGKGCGGGYTEWAFDYIKSSSGVETSADYPYQLITNTTNFGQAYVITNLYIFTKKYKLGGFLFKWSHLVCWSFLPFKTIAAHLVSYTYTGGVSNMMTSLINNRVLSVCFYVSKTFRHYKYVI